MFGIENLEKDSLLVSGKLIQPLFYNLFTFDFLIGKSWDVKLVGNDETYTVQSLTQNEINSNSTNSIAFEDRENTIYLDFEKKSNVNYLNKNRICKGEKDDDDDKIRCDGKERDKDRDRDGNGDGGELEIEGFKKAKQFFKKNDPLNLASKFTEVEIELTTGKKGLNQLLKIPNFANLLEEFGLKVKQLKALLKGNEVEIERKKRFPNGTVIELELEGEEGKVELELNIKRDNLGTGDCLPNVKKIGGTPIDKITNYDNVFISDRRLIFTFSSPENSGDRVDIIFKGQTIANNLLLTTDGTEITLPDLNLGPNDLQVRFGSSRSRSIKVHVDVPIDTNFYGADTYEAIIQRGCPLRLKIGLPLIRIPGKPDTKLNIKKGVPFVAQNIIDTLGEPIKLTRDTEGRATARRNRRVNNYTKVFGLIPKNFQRDEAPPAIGNEDVDRDRLPLPNVRAIPALDNTKGGTIQRDLFNKYGSDAKEIPVDGVVDFYATTPVYVTGVSKIIPRYGTKGNDRLTPRPSPGNTGLVYGFGGDDTITGKDNSRDTLLGGFGDDILRGRDKNDIIVGQPGEDVLFGGKGNDVVYGGPGNDVLYGSEGNDIFVFKKSKNEGIDLVRDFDFQKGEIIDKFDLSSSSSASFKLNQIINGKRENGDEFIQDVLPDYPLVSKDEINPYGTEVFSGVGVNRQTLAYFEGINAKELMDDRNNLFVGKTSKTSLPDPQGLIPPELEILV